MTNLEFSQNDHNLPCCIIVNRNIKGQSRTERDRARQNNGLFLHICSRFPRVKSYGRLENKGMFPQRKVLPKEENGDGWPYEFWHL